MVANVFCSTASGVALTAAGYENVGENREQARYVSCPARLGLTLLHHGILHNGVQLENGSNVGLISHGGVSGMGARENEHFSGGKY